MTLNSMGRAFWCFFWKLAALKACVDSASLWCPAVLRLRKHPPIKNTIFPQHHQPCSSSQYSAPSSFPPVCRLWTSAPWLSPQVTWNHKRQPSHHIFIWKTTLTEFLLIKHAFCQCAMLRAIKLWLLMSDCQWFDIRSLSHQKWLL